MINDIFFQPYIQLGEVLGKMFPNILEVIVHNFSDLDHSVIFIINGHISGRKVGDGASELGLRRLLESEDIPDVLINYTNVNQRGNKLKSSSIAIRDPDGKMIGAFCLNFDVTFFEHFHKFLQPLICSESLSLVGTEELVSPPPIKEEVSQIIQDYLLQHNLMFANLSYGDKEAIVVHLDGKGCFKQRGAMLAVANALKITRQSIYKYLKRK
jgi:predicted transcriptional regulator YheO